MSKRARNWGVVAEFDNPARLLEAAHAVQDDGYRKWETWSPFPIHGMDDAQGLGGSKVPWIVLVMGVTGLITGFVLQWWSGAIEYPIVIGGKPLYAWEFAVPVTFEIAILLSAFGAVFGMFALNALPRPFHPLDRHKPFRKVTDDGFFLSIEAKDPRFHIEDTKDFLESLGGADVTVVEA